MTQMILFFDTPPLAKLIRQLATMMFRVAADRSGYRKKYYN
jgi:hypothetical protein